MARTREGNGTLKCSFCGKSQNDVRKLIAGPTVYICNECIELCNDIIAEEWEEEKSREIRALPKPAEIKNVLDQYVIGQERDKHILAVAVHNHYKRIESGSEAGEVELQKSNILLIGPTGSGKTLLAQTLAKMLRVPFTIADATTLTEAGYVGEDVENIILRLLQAADYDEERRVGDLLAMIQPEDLLKYGLIPEFVGRLPIIATLHDLDEPALVRILREPKNAIVKQYQKYFDLEKVRLKFTEDAVAAIAKEALKRGTGARGLRAILEEVMLEIMYELPSIQGLKECIITREVILNRERPLLVPEAQEQSA